MIDLKLDMSQFQRAALNAGGAIDQVPFALSRALNEAAKVTYEHLITETWPRSVEVRNRQFIRASLRTEFADKRNLRVSIRDVLGHGNLELHAKGGSKLVIGRAAMPTPAAKAHRGSRGIQFNYRPMSLRRAVLKGNLLFQAVGRGKNSKLQLMYKLVRSVTVRKDVPFHEDFASVMRREVARAFPAAMQQAMRTRRR